MNIRASPLTTSPHPLRCTFCSVRFMVMLSGTLSEERTAHKGYYFDLRCVLICPSIATFGIEIGNRICWGVTPSNTIIRRCGSKGGTNSIIPDPSSGLATQNKMRNVTCKPRREWSSQVSHEKSNPANKMGKCIIIGHNLQNFRQLCGTFSTTHETDPWGTIYEI